MWSEEEVREVPDPVIPDQIIPDLIIPDPPRRPPSQSAPLRHDIITRNLTLAHSHPHELTRSSSVIYTPAPAAHGNFLEASYRRICARPDWRLRLQKPHTSRHRARLTTTRLDPWCELDAATSSDALLMNIFCYPRVLASAPLPALLGIDRNTEPIFGFKPRIPLHRGLTDTTEIDLKLGPLLIEAKLTESTFPSAPLRKLERYRDLDLVFEPNLFAAGPVPAYQLIRGVLAAHTHSAIFCLLTDARRPDLIEPWFTVLASVRSATLRSRLRLLTWQELAPTLPRPLAAFIAAKYGIEAHGRGCGCPTSRL